MSNIKALSDEEACGIEVIAESLLQRIAEFPHAVIAFSGGVDSAVVAAAAQRALGEKALAVMSISPSVPSRQIELASAVAEEIGITLRTVETRETERLDYQANDSNRCFFCKQTLYAAINPIAKEFPHAAIISGTNADDLGDHRPGIDAGRRADVRTPLADLGITKIQVRALARHWELSVADLPAGPCLASRIAYGEPVSVAKLKMIDQAENVLRDLDFDVVRVRFHPGHHARIEVEADRIGDLCVLPLRKTVNDRLREIGFRFVSIDLEGFRSGNLNQLVTIETGSR